MQYNSCLELTDSFGNTNSMNWKGCLKEWGVCLRDWVYTFLLIRVSTDYKPNCKDFDYNIIYDLIYRIPDLSNILVGISFNKMEDGQQIHCGWVKNTFWVFIDVILNRREMVKCIFYMFIRY